MPGFSILSHEIQQSGAEGTALTPQMASEEAVAEQQAPKMIEPKNSIKEDKVICLECGAEMRQLTQKHLSSHGITSKEYKKKYGFSMRTPLAAKSLTKARSKAAKKRGLPENLTKFIEARRQEKAVAAATMATKTVEANKPKRTRLRKKKAV